MTHINNNTATDVYLGIGVASIVVRYQPVSYTHLTLPTNIAV